MALLRNILAPALLATEIEARRKNACLKDTACWASIVGVIGFLALVALVYTYPRARRNLPSPRTIHVVAAASLRPVSTEYPRRSRGVAARL